MCLRIVPSRTPQHRVVVETRLSTYPVRRDANRFLRDGRLKLRDDPGGRGREIAREVSACPECFDALDAETHDQADSAVTRPRSPPPRAA